MCNRNLVCQPSNSGGRTSAQLTGNHMSLSPSLDDTFPFLLQFDTQQKKKKPRVVKKESCVWKGIEEFTGNHVHQTGSSVGRAPGFEFHCGGHLI